MNPAWHEPAGLRIWRLPGLRSEIDEMLATDDACTDEALAAVAAQGFTAIWFFADLYDLMGSTPFPELERPHAATCRQKLQRAIDRAASHGLGVWLYVNEPGGVPAEHPFWKGREHLQGDAKWGKRALCTSTPEVRDFLREALGGIFGELRGVQGVILITACENLTHCWSKRQPRLGGEPTTCPRCREREPADLIGELLRIWADVRDAQPSPFRIVAWNWEWAYYYADPPHPILAQLPAGVELLLDMEIGGTDARGVAIGEYALSYPGPSPRLLATRRAAGDHLVHAKLQINTSHELCTVPSLPVIATLHRKFVALEDEAMSGFMGCWNIGLETESLNIRALRCFARDPAGCRDRDRFLRVLATEVFPTADHEALVAAWLAFSEAFTHYPFSIPMLYYGPFNDGPGRLFSLHFRGEPTGRSFADDPPGDDLTRCFGDWPLDDIIAEVQRMVDGWETGLRHYACLPADHPEHRVARMIGCHLRSALHAFRFQAERARLLREHRLSPPCDLPRDPALLDTMRAELANAQAALPLAAADPRFGFHESYQGRKYTAATIQHKIKRLQQELDT